MSIFDKDRIGHNVFCRVKDVDTDEVRYGYVKWVHAYPGGMVKVIEGVGPGKLHGNWRIEELDVEPTQELLLSLTG